MIELPKYPPLGSVGALEAKKLLRAIATIILASIEEEPPKKKRKTRRASKKSKTKKRRVSKAPHKKAKST